MARRLAPEVNAGSMADIAFLLLIFFLVTTTLEADSGISRRLPPLQDNRPPDDHLIKEKNLFIVRINKGNELLVEKKPMDLKDLRSTAIEFLDNGGGKDDEGCDYCRGAKDPKSSDNPDKAVISLGNDRETNYASYIAVQNELVAAYMDLRNREAKRLFGRSFVQMLKDLKDVNYSLNKDVLKERLKTIRSMYPERLSEAEARSNN